MGKAKKCVRCKKEAISEVISTWQAREAQEKRAVYLSRCAVVGMHR